MTKQKLEQTYQSLLAFYGKHDKIPIDVFASQIGSAREQAQKLLEDLKEDGVSLLPQPPTIDADRTIEWSTPPISSETTTKIVPIAMTKPQQAYEEPPIKPKRVPSKKKTQVRPVVEDNYAVYFLKILALPFSIFAIGLSCFFSASFLAKQFPMLLAIILSATVIGFGVFCFESAVLFLKRRAWAWMVLFGVLWAGITVYSGGTTISSLYESYLLRIYNKQESSLETTSNRKVYDSYVAEEKEKQVLMEDKRTRLISNQNILKELDTLTEQNENRKQYDNAYWAAWGLEKDIVLLSKEISELRKKQQDILKQDSGITRDIVIENKPDVYTWLASIFHVTSDFMQFILQAIPALVLDVVSPTALYVALFLKKNTNTLIVKKETK